MGDKQWKFNKSHIEKKLFNLFDINLEKPYFHILHGNILQLFTKIIYPKKLSVIYQRPKLKHAHNLANDGHNRLRSCLVLSFFFICTLLRTSFYA